MQIFKTEDNNLSNQRISLQLGVSSRRVDHMKKQFKAAGDTKKTDKSNRSRGPAKKMSPQNQLIVDFIRNDRFISTRHLLKRLKDSGYEMSCSSLFNRLAELGYTFRRDIHMPGTKNTTKIIEERFNFVQWISKVPDQNLFYAGQTTIDLGLQNQYGWVHNEEQVDQFSKQYIQAKHSFLVVYISIGVNGIVGFKISDERENTTSFVNHMSECLAPLLSERDVLLLDPNFLHSSHLVNYYLDKQKIHFKYLPQYTPCMNPTFHILNLVKTKICKKIRRQKITDIFTLHDQLGKVLSKYQTLSLFQLYDEMRSMCQKAKFRDKL